MECFSRKRSQFASQIYIITVPGITAVAETCRHGIFKNFFLFFCDKCKLQAFTTLFCILFYLGECLCDITFSKRKCITTSCTFSRILSYYKVFITAYLCTIFIAKQIDIGKWSVTCHCAWHSNTAVYPVFIFRLRYRPFKHK